MHAMTNKTAADRKANAGKWEQGRTQEILVFNLGNEKYGIDIQKVQALRGYHGIAAIADAPELIKGVIDLHGAAVPVIDMRIKFNVGTPSYDQFTAVIVLDIAGCPIGMVVDRVLERIQVGTERITPAPEIGTAPDNGHPIGMSTIDGHMVILLDMEKLMSSMEIKFAETLARGR